MSKGQAEHLVPMLEAVLAEAQVNWSDLARLGVGIGPGNFTGIRISVATARGLALGLDIPAVGVSAFDALYEGQTNTALIAIDARGGQTYVQIKNCFETAQGPENICNTPKVIRHVEDLHKPDLAASLAIRPNWQDKIDLEIDLPFAPAKYPIAEAIARIACRVNPDNHPPKPLYIRQADAAPPKDPAPTLLP
jgi:tRNA threonylcarbamoyl adenosine modification protein YeaZ